MFLSFCLMFCQFSGPVDKGGQSFPPFLLSHKKFNASSVGIGMTSGFKSIIHRSRTTVIRNFKSFRADALFEAIIYGKSNSVKPMWSLLFKFKQKWIHLFCSVCSFFFRLLFKLGYQGEHP